MANGIYTGNCASRIALFHRREIYNPDDAGNGAGGGSDRLGAYCSAAS